MTPLHTTSIQTTFYVAQKLTARLLDKADEYNYKCQIRYGQKQHKMFAVTRTCRISAYITTSYYVETAWTLTVT